MNDAEILTVTKIIERYALMANALAALCVRARARVCVCVCVCVCAPL